MVNAKDSVTVSELNIVDGEGRRRMTLSASSGTPSMEMFSVDGRTTFAVSMDEFGRTAVRLGNSDDTGPVATIEVVETGTHVKFTRPAGGASYLFLNNAGGSGLVLIDAKGVRRLVALNPADGNVRIEKFDSEGKALP